MRIYFYLNQLPELRHGPANKRSKATKGLRLTREVWGYALAMLTWIATGTLFYFVIEWFWPIEQLSDTREIMTTVGRIVPTILASIVFYIKYISSARPEVRRRLRELYRGERLPSCFKCGCDLRDTEGYKCPDCGSAIAVSFPAHQIVDE
jgi:hypothetical protein